MLCKFRIMMESKDLSLAFDSSDRERHWSITDLRLAKLHVLKGLEQRNLLQITDLFVFDFGPNRNKLYVMMKVSNSDKIK